MKKVLVKIIEFVSFSVQNALDTQWKVTNERNLILRKLTEELVLREVILKFLPKIRIS